MRRSVLLLGACVLVSCALVACASWRLAGLEPLPMGEPFRGPEGSYTLTPPSGEWVRVEDSEGDRIDLALARRSNDAWLNVSVLPRRFATAELALADARSRMDSLMLTLTREEWEVTVPSPEGDRPGRFGIYCGTFDRELRSRDSCFVMLTTIRAELTYALVAQVRIRDPEPGRQDELERLVRSLRLLAGAAGR